MQIGFSLLKKRGLAGTGMPTPEPETRGMLEDNPAKASGRIVRGRELTEEKPRNFNRE